MLFNEPNYFSHYVCFCFDTISYFSFTNTMQYKVHTTSNNSESFSDQNSMDHATMMKISRYKTIKNKPIFLYTEENKFSSESDKSVTRKRMKYPMEIKSKENINSTNQKTGNQIYL